MALVCDVYYDFVTFPFGIPGQVWYMIVSIPDPCCLSYFKNSSATRYIRASVLWRFSSHRWKKVSEYARSPAFPDQFKKIKHYKRLGYSMDFMRQLACLIKTNSRFMAVVSASIARRWAKPQAQ